MKYKVVTSCHGFLGRMWEEGEIVEVDPSTNPPRHLVPLEDTQEDVPKPPPHRTESQDVMPGTQRSVVGGMSAGLTDERIPNKGSTTDQLPNNVKPRRRRAAPSKKKGVGSVKK